MKMIWHIMKKDFRAIWPLWAAWMGLIAVKILLLYYYLNHAESRAFSLMPMVSGCGFLADIILVASLVQNLVHEDGLVGDRLAWVTRPISGRQLLVAKLLSALLVCVVSPLVLMLPVWLVFGCNSEDLAYVLVCHCTLNGSVVLAALAFSVITQRGNSFWLVVVASIISAALFAMGVEEGLRTSELHNIDKKLYWWVVVVGVVIVLFGVVWQYLKRRVWVARIVFGTIVVMAGILLPSSSGKSPFKDEFRNYKLNMPAEASWLEAKQIANAKGRSHIEGVIEVVTPAQNQTPRMRYSKGVWIDAEGRKDRALALNRSREVDSVSILPEKNELAQGQYRYKFPISLSSPRFDGVEAEGPIGYSGRISLSFWRTEKLAEADLASGETARSENFFARVVSVKTYEKAIETKTVEAGVGSGFQSVRIELVNGYPSEWRLKEWDGGNSGMLLWIGLRAHLSTHVSSKDMTNPEWSGRDRGAPTHEDLREKHWRILWKNEVPVGAAGCELKAERLEITKE